MKNYHHLIEIDETKNKLTIYRLFGGGEKEVYTSIELPIINAQDNWDSFESFALTLGENILMDSPSARRLLNL
jgi:hypothetical protein